MVPKGLRTTVLAVALVAAWSLATDASQSAMAIGPKQGAGDLFYNYYVPPGPCGGVGAQLYVAPRPTPPLVGHTYVTYQPLMPHEFLYQHHRVYYTCNPGAGLTRTTVHWR
jgi:hypothetical protein